MVMQKSLLSCIEPLSQLFDAVCFLRYCQGMSRFQISGFYVLPMRYLNSRFTLVNGNITDLTWIALNSCYCKANKSDFDALSFIPKTLFKDYWGNY